MAKAKAISRLGTSIHRKMYILKSIHLLKIQIGSDCVSSLLRKIFSELQETIGLPDAVKEEFEEQLSRAEKKLNVDGDDCTTFSVS